LVINNFAINVYGDRERIGQVISNLLTNAVKYGLGKEVRLETALNGSMMICSVHDDGIGILKDQQIKVFERFYRISGTNLHTYPGLGLGLYISKEIIQRHDGEIWVESGPGSGTTFYFTLPATQI
jgi:signal transduction histidine kinase